MLLIMMLHNIFILFIVYFIILFYLDDVYYSILFDGDNDFVYLNGDIKLFDGRLI